MASTVVVVLCSGDDEIATAVQYWENERGYNLAGRSEADNDAGHYVVGASGDYTRSSCSPLGTFKTALTFEHD
jgi:hypothetical protein